MAAPADVRCRVIADAIRRTRRLALTNPVYEVKGDVNFAPAANRTYIVRGELRADYAAVWLEDAETNAVIGNKIELKGDPSLGVLEK
jgi:hypothetical protein